MGTVPRDHMTYGVHTRIWLQMLHETLMTCIHRCLGHEHLLSKLLTGTAEHSAGCQGFGVRTTVSSCGI